MNPSPASGSGPAVARLLVGDTSGWKKDWMEGNRGDMLERVLDAKEEMEYVKCTAVMSSLVGGYCANVVLLLLHRF